MKFPNPNAIVAEVMGIILELHNAYKRIAALEHENKELIDEIRVLKLKDILRSEYGNKNHFVKQYSIDGAVK
jgi:hypothetical protein